MVKIFAQLSPQIIINGFRASDLSPWVPLIKDFSKCLWGKGFNKEPDSCDDEICKYDNAQD